MIYFFFSLSIFALRIENLLKTKDCNFRDAKKTINSYKKYFFIKLTFIQFYSSLKYTHYIKTFGQNSLQLPCKSETPVHESQ